MKSSWLESQPLHSDSQSNVSMSVRAVRRQGRQGSGAHFPHPGSNFFRNSHFSESLLPLKRHRGEPTHTHGTHGRTRAHASHRRTSQDTTQEPSKLTNTPARPHDRTTARRPNPRPTQQPQPRSRTLPTAEGRLLKRCRENVRSRCTFTQPGRDRIWLLPARRAPSSARAALSL